MGCYRSLLMSLAMFLSHTSRFLKTPLAVWIEGYRTHKWAGILRGELP